jgi:hypothetical protein
VDRPVDYRRTAVEFRTRLLASVSGGSGKVCSQYVMILDDLIEQSIKYARDNSIDDQDFRYDLLGKVEDFLTEFANAFTTREELVNIRSLWRHRLSPLSDLASKTTPKMDRESLQCSVSTYLELPVKHQRVDRVLIDALTAIELFAFGEEMLNEKKIPGIPPRSPLRLSHPLWVFVRGQFGNLFLACVLFAFAIGAYKFSWIAEMGLVTTGTILIGLLGLLFIVSLIALPGYWRRQGAAKRKITDLLEAMNTAYNELNSSGLISARHFRQRLTWAAEKGVIWPSDLFVLLDDLEARGGRF